MKTYKAQAVKDPDLRRELEAIEEAAARPEPFLRLQVTTAAPTKYQEGDIYRADGVGWNPGGTGAGFYGRTGGAWVKL